MADPNLLERIGLGMGGYVPLDPAMMQSAGLDPVEVQRQAAASTLRAFLGGLAQAKGGKGRKASLLEALNAGFANAAGTGAQRRTQDLNAAYMAQNMKRTATADEAARAEAAKDAELAKRLQSDEFWKLQAPELQAYRPILANLPPRQAVQLLAETQRQNATDERQQRLFAQQAGLQDDRQAAAEALAAQRHQQTLAALMARQAQGGGGAPDFNDLTALLDQPGYEATTERGKALRSKLGITEGRAPASVQAKTAAAVDAAIADERTGYDMLQKLQRAKQLLLGGKVQTGMVASTLAAVSPSLLDPDTQEFYSLVKDQIGDVAKSYKGPFTDRDALTAELSRFNLGPDTATNLKVVDRLIAQTQRGLAQSQALMQHADQGGTVLDFGSMASRGQAPAPPGAPAATPAAAPQPRSAPAGAQPQEGPPGAVFRDGAWYDPVTGKRYRWEGS